MKTFNTNRFHAPRIAAEAQLKELREAGSKDAIEIARLQAILRILPSKDVKFR